MSLRSPTLEGFRAAFRRPSLTLAEIVWRWAVGATAAALFVFGGFEYLNTLPVTSGELLFLRTRHPYLVAEAIAHILRGSLNRAVMSALLAAFMLAVLWVIAASVGRVATVRALLDYFRGDVATNLSAGGVSEEKRREVASHISTSGESAPWPALLRLNFLRVAVALAAGFAIVGAAIMAGFASPDAHPQPGLAFSVFLPVAGLICYLWWALNWLLSLAGMFAVRDGSDAVGAIASATALCNERTGPVFAVTTWMGLAHLVAFVAAITVASIPLGFAGVVPWRLIVAADALVTLAYFAVVDWLYMARLAGYVVIVEAPQAWLAPSSPMQLPKHGPALLTTIDRNELILSDVPNLAVET